MIEEEIYSGVDEEGVEVMLRKLDETSWIVDVRQQDDYLEGYEYENYADALNQYNKLNESRQKHDRRNHALYYDRAL